VRHAVVIASTRRPQLLGETLASLLAQTRPADVVLVSVAERSDAPVPLPVGVQLVLAPRGLTRQRNAALDALDPDVELVTFFDDDAEPAHDYLEKARAFAERHPDVVLFDGRVVADGSVSGEISRDDARLLLADHVPTEAARRQPEAYGCNMTVRRMVAALVRFDERLPLYGWLEDRDFAIRCARLGPVLRYEGCAIVHLGTSSGRLAGSRMGWSQVVNPYYLWDKGVLSSRQLGQFWLRAIGGNAHGLMRHDPVLDRRGRLTGNLRGFGAVLRRQGPEGVLEISQPTGRAVRAVSYESNDALRTAAIEPA
jgi:GT2 family glycosyltransferase